ncbi:uncharacterized protein LOC116848097 [Odontomachus brunneus]|uniref:uncharacterized protein LOC116848097 n=1 Tax=Odontomachus brunneus TaxID=486640 RepID=UPI0013F22038|nr:uncharacterized protein LOC116848097 [Odontomachus brunneus]
MALEANLGRGRQAQTLIAQILAERGLNLSVVTEPYWAPRDDPYWVVAPGGSATIKKQRAPLLQSNKLDGNRALPVYESILDGIVDFIRHCVLRSVVVDGDFNAHSSVWDGRLRRPHLRGRSLEEWAATNGLLLLNRGSEDIFDPPVGEPPKSSKLAGMQLPANRPFSEPKHFLELNSGEEVAR